MSSSIPTILVIVGISGDLAQRKLLPAIAEIAAADALPEKFAVLGITRRSDLSIDQLLSNLKKPAVLKDSSELFQMDLTSVGEYQRLAQRLDELEKQMGGAVQRLYYLSIPPTVARPIIEMLGESGLAKVPGTKLLLEKPFGVDLASAQELITHLDQYFSPEQVYRIDHYLAKETVQNLIVFRENNSLFKRSWNKDFIERIEIIATEEIGVEGRATFYEQTGALRDVVQSHLLELAALTLMAPSQSGSFYDVPNRRLEALRYLEVPTGEEIQATAHRAQYSGYAEEVKNPGSLVETFVSLQLSSRDPRWQGVPIILTTGKALNEKVTQIKIHYKKDHGYEATELIIQLQPDERVELAIWTKEPGYGQKVSSHSLRFTYRDHYANLPEAYEQVIFNAINSDHSLFTTSAEVLETWRILDPIQQLWEMNPEGLRVYQPGSSVAEVLESASV